MNKKPTKDEIVDKLYHMYDGFNSTGQKNRETVADWVLSLWPEEPKAIGFKEWVKQFELCQSGPEIWQAAQAALIASGEVIQVPKEWPEWATEVACCFVGRDSFKEAFLTRNFCRHAPENNFDTIKRIPRPQSLWKPKTGEKVWIIEPGCYPYLCKMSVYKPDPGTLIAAFEDIHEIDYTVDQFRQRGRFWEAK